MDTAKTETIKTILTRLNGLILNDDYFQGIKMECYVKGIKRYEWASYFELYDSSGSISGNIQTNRMHEDLKENMKISFYGNLKIDKLNKASISLINYTIKDTKAKDKYSIVYDQLKKDSMIGLEKRIIHNNYKNIGLITSTNAAGLKDILSTLKKNMSNGNVIIYSTLVQGSGMVSSIIKRIEQANLENRCDVLLLARGGGSKSDLEWFDDYDLAKSLINSKIPTTCGIGHEIDKTIVDLIVDKSFITPTDAANKLTCGQLEYKHKLDKMILKHNHLTNDFSNRLNGYTQTYTYLKGALGDKILNDSKRMIELNNMICYEVTNKMENYLVRYSNLEKIVYFYLAKLNGCEKELQKYDPILDLTKKRVSDIVKHYEYLRTPKIMHKRKLITSKDDLEQIIKNGDKVSIKFLDGEYKIN